MRSDEDEAAGLPPGQIEHQVLACHPEMFKRVPSECAVTRQLLADVAFHISMTYRIMGRITRSDDLAQMGAQPILQIGERVLLRAR